MNAIEFLHRMSQYVPNEEFAEYLEVREALEELAEAAAAVAFVQLNRRAPANDLGKAKQLRLRAALAKVKGDKP